MAWARYSRRSALMNSWVGRTLQGLGDKIVALAPTELSHLVASHSALGASFARRCLALDPLHR